MYDRALWLVAASREAVRLWVQWLESLAYHGPPRPRRLVAIDETGDQDEA
ncbi:MAG: hypothetical protein ACP5K1_06665 [Candidatus Bathyarchaeia archaeon]